MDRRAARIERAREKPPARQFPDTHRIVFMINNMLFL